MTKFVYRPNAGSSAALDELKKKQWDASVTRALGVCLALGAALAFLIGGTPLTNSPLAASYVQWLAQYIPVLATGEGPSAFPEKLALWKAIMIPVALASNVWGGVTYPACIVLRKTPNRLSPAMIFIYSPAVMLLLLFMLKLLFVGAPGSEHSRAFIFVNLYSNSTLGLATAGSLWVVSFSVIMLFTLMCLKMAAAFIFCRKDRHE